jgi:hypothetical protein
MLSEAGFISSEKVAVGSMLRLTPVCLLSGVTVSGVGALLSSFTVKVFGASTFPALSVAK